MTDAPPRPSWRERRENVRDRVDLVELIGRSVRLGRARRPRGQCPFHGSKSDSFVVDPEKGRARCYGCDWHGDAIDFVRDMQGIDWKAALEQLEGGARVAEANPVQRDKIMRPKREDDDFVDPVELGRFIWRLARPDQAAVRRWFVARGVPEAVLTDARLADVQFAAQAPVSCWSRSRGPSSVPQAPAIAALVRHPDDWRPLGLHVTFLSPGGTAKMVRKRADGSEMPARKMLGEIGGGVVLLGAISGAMDAPLFAGEGLETVLSGMAMMDATDTAIGVAALSLVNLQGSPKQWRGGVLPLFDIAPDPERPGVAWAGEGPVTVLVDADMKPLRGPRNAGVALVEARGGAIVRRWITSAERSEICAQLAVASWRRAGRRVVKAVRPHMGQDFNDASRAA